jgi:hypothetical protein
MPAAAICGGVEAASVLRYAHHLATAVRSGSAAEGSPSSLSSLDGVGGSNLR